MGREVAIRVIGPELANNPNFIRRFEAQAQQIARLEHPQVVPLFDYWREPDSAYLVMRSFEHGALADVLESGPMSTEMGTRVINHVGAALGAAHRRGVVHGDVKAANILIDGDGNAYLSDFAMTFGDAAPISDIHALADVAAGVLEGTVGRDGVGDSPLVGPASVVISKAKGEFPGDQFETVEAFLDALNETLGAVDELEAHVVSEVENPYQGLRAFEEDDAARFFGRERLVERLLARLGRSDPRGGLVALVGPSGSGKSSVVRAGVVPALRQGALVGSDRWFVVTMTPGRHPFEELEDALLKIAVNPPVNLLDQLTANGVSTAVKSLIPEAIRNWSSLSISSRNCSRTPRRQTLTSS